MHDRPCRKVYNNRHLQAKKIIPLRFSTKNSADLDFPRVDHTWYQKEETANTITHFFAFFCAIVGASFLLVKVWGRQDLTTLIACTVYVTCVASTFLTSAVYHSSRAPKFRHILHICDHMVIYLMIAGTYTPFTLITLHGVWGWSLLGVLWGLTAMGLVFKLFFTGRFNLLSTAIYVMMGWIGVIAIVPIIEALPAGGLFWLILGGAMYTLGVMFYLMETVPFSHTVWHLFVMAGALAHYICIYNYVIQ